MAKRIQGEEVGSADLASLVRSWCALMDCIRVMRGIPSPGHLRPDLDPEQVNKALKRLKARLPIEIESADALLDGPDDTPTTATPTPNETSKESLLPGQTVPAVAG